ncbi:MAG: hypothetical protein Q9167_002794 [Letrouitia subvulpina]
MGTSKAAYLDRTQPRRLAYPAGACHCYTPKAFTALPISVAGIIFLGTPFQGSDVAVYRKWLDPKASRFKPVHDWLYMEKHRNWLLILDNVDNALFPSKAENSWSESAGERRGLAGATSVPPSKPERDGSNHDSGQRASIKAVEDKDIIIVEPMKRVHALALLEKKLGVRGNDEGVSDLVVALEFMPLAIVQAAALISQRAPWNVVRLPKKRWREDQSSKL